MPEAWFVWWSALCALALFNAGAWRYSAHRLRRSQQCLPGDVVATRRVLLWLSAGYLLGCAFRSFLPLVDVPRMCLHDTWLSRVVIGRSVATVAELCFALQWALLLQEAGGKAPPRRYAGWVALLLVPLIAVAEALSWGAVLLANNLLHAAENSLWTLGAALAVAAFLAQLPHADPRSRRFLIAAAIGGSCYVVFMIAIDVPMYLSRWRADFATGQPGPTLMQGWHQILARCTVVRDWEAWREDARWLSLYFSVAVWTSLAIAHAPPLRQPRTSLPACQPAGE